MTAILLLAIVLATAPPAGSQQPARDAPGAAASETSRISGVVLAGERTQQPVRRALVTIGGSALSVSRSTITDDDGRFSFVDLPAGRFIVTAARRAFLTASFGSTGPGRPGTPLRLAAGEHASNVAITLPRGAVLTGAITDAGGAPVPALPVTVFRLASTYTAAGAGMTDDRGIYRVFGLPPGDYIVAAVPRPTGVGDMAVMSEREVDAALSALERRGGGSSPAAVAPGATPATEPQASASLRVASFAPFFYPGTPVAAEAMKVSVAAGEERAGLDFTLGIVPTASVAGIVTGADGRPAAGVQLTILSTGPSLPLALGMGPIGPMRTGPDGTFHLASVTPGTYRLTARRAPASSRPQPGPFMFPPSAGRGPTSEWAVADVVVAGQDIDGVSMWLQPGLRVAGRVIFEGTGTVPQKLGALRVTIAPEPLPARGGGIPPVVVNTDGTFEITNLLPGRYTLGVTLSDHTAGNWWPRSAESGGRDLFDLPLDLSPGGKVPEVVMTLSERRPSLSGVVRAADGAPAADGFVVVFSADRAFWRSGSRRIRGVRLATDGHYRVQDLPPGDYLIAAMLDAEPDEWYDAAFLSRLAAGAVRVTVGEGEQKTQDVRMSGRRP